MSDTTTDPTDELLEVENEPGLSSAMHDITMLAKSYRQAGITSAESQPLELGNVSMTPSFLLTPSSAPRRDSWKSAALALMVLLGLSTSALALSLFYRSGEVAMVPTPLLLDRDAAVPSITVPAEESSALVPAPEEPPYQVTSTPGVTPAVEEVRAVVTPPASKAQLPREPRAKAATSRVAKIDSCDEVACLIDGSAACCEGVGSVRAEQDLAKEAPARPYRLTRSEIMKPMQSIAGRVTRCADSYGVSETTMVNLVVAPEGTITSVALNSGSPAFQSCVEGEVRSLRFRELSQSFRFSYPYVF